MSTGDTSDAEKLVAILKKQRTDYMLGMINAYPSGIGGDETTILTVGSTGTWDRYGTLL